MSGDFIITELQNYTNYRGVMVVMPVICNSCNKKYSRALASPHCEIWGNRATRSRRVKKRRPFDCFKSA